MFHAHPHSHVPRALTLTALAALTLLGACGGGGGGGSTGSNASASSMSGTVAVGAPMVNATVTLKDANGVTRTASVGSDGAYSGLDVSGLTGPFRVQACGLVEGTQACYYSVVSQAGRANVTPLTNASVSLAMGQDAAALFDSDAPAPSATSLDAQKQKLLTALQPVISSVVGSSSVDFATTAFTADRTGMDKLLDAVRISTGTSGGSAPFVQIEGRLDGGNVYIDPGSAPAGTLGGDTSKLSVNMSGITTVFSALSHAVNAANVSACAGLMSANLFDDAFSLNIDHSGALTKSTVATGLCTLADNQGFLGGVFADPVIKDCDFSGNDKFCTVTFNLVKGDSVMSGAELAVVQRQADGIWRLLGQDSTYEIHVNATISRRVRVDRNDIDPVYTRAISFDIGTTYASGVPVIGSARVYQRDLSGTGWEATPLAQLNAGDASCISALTPRLTIAGSSCGSTWYQLDGNSTDTAAADVLVDNFFKRGRQVKIVLYSDTNYTTVLDTVYKRIDGVPLKFADLPSFPWFELDSATKSNLVTYDGTSANFSTTFALNRKVGAKDLSFYLAGNVSAMPSSQEIMPSASGPTTTVLNLSSHRPSAASDLKSVAVYGRTPEQMGVESVFISCNAATNCPY